MDKAEALARLRALEPDLRDRGVERLSLFGSTARGEQCANSDLDLAIELRTDVRMGVFAFLALERHIATMLEASVDLIMEPHDQAPRLQAEIDKDRVHVF